VGGQVTLNVLVDVATPEADVTVMRAVTAPVGMVTTTLVTLDFLALMAAWAPR
jgi:hypothetical protein